MDAHFLPRTRALARLVKAVALFGNDVLENLVPHRFDQFGRRCVQRFRVANGIRQTRHYCGAQKLAPLPAGSSPPRTPLVEPARIVPPASIPPPTSAASGKWAIAAGFLLRCNRSILLREQPCHIGGGSAINFIGRDRSSTHRWPALSIAFGMTTNFRMHAVRGIFGDFPARRTRSWNSRNEGLRRTATRVLQYFHSSVDIREIRRDRPVEADETMVGGLARFMHKENKAQKITGTGGAGKELVMGSLDRETGKIRVKHIANRKRTLCKRKCARSRSGLRGVHRRTGVLYRTQ
jgi:hypothetical protein